MPSTRRVFLSYSAADRELAKDLARLMTQRGLSVISVFNLEPGTEWPEVLRVELEKASALVLLIPSNDVPNRNYVWFEVGAARALGKRILAVLPPTHRSVDLPTDIADVLVLDADKRPLESIADTLIQAVPETDSADVSAN